jgi:hypothetical protein
MTSEVIVMNSLGVALAADSAATVTSGRGRKVFNSADKLFMLSQKHPVGVMIYENAFLAGVPWEAILKVFRRRLGAREFPRLEDYTQELIRFLNEDRVLSSSEAQDFYYQRAVEKLFASLAKKQRASLKAAYARGDDPDEASVAQELIFAERDKWLNGPDTECFDPKTGANLAARFSGQINDLSAKFFGGPPPLHRESVLALAELSRLIVSKARIQVETMTGVVIAGFGCDEYFPTAQIVEVGEVFDNRLKYRIKATKRITHENSSEVVAFAQSEMVNTFLHGINPTSNVLIVEQLTDFIIGLQQEMIEAITDLAPERQKHWIEAFRPGTIDDVSKLLQGLESDRQDRHLKPIKEAIASMPKDELASAAARLVGLNSFQKRMSLTDETVGGPIDVAVISKGDGFIWIDRKHYFRPELNRHFFDSHRATAITGEGNVDHERSTQITTGASESQRKDRG